MNLTKRWLAVVAYAAGMAWVESAVVYYLRTMVDRIVPYQPYPLPIIGGLGTVEVVREAATILMLFSVGYLAGRTWRARLGYFAIAFGAWDIFYYAFLKVICGWPTSLLDWDILFLIPLPWWGPVLAPMSIALLMIFWGTLVSGWNINLKGYAEWKGWALSFFGVCLALYLFMADAIGVADKGLDVLRRLLPVWFNWPLFCVALGLMGAPIVQLALHLYRAKKGVREPINFARWLQHFERNRENRHEPDWSMPIPIMPHDMESLLKSLAQFQLGDGGGPASLIAKNADQFRKSTEEMTKVVDCWFREEREHSRLLKSAVQALGGKLIQSHWSFSAFCASRRIFGVGFELQVLLLTEITSTAYYQLLKRHCKIPALEATCALILHDEAGHVSFHRDRLAAEGRRPDGIRGRIWAAQFWVCGFAAASMLWVNHRSCLTSLGATTREYYNEVRMGVERFLNGLRADGLQRSSSQISVRQSRELDAVIN